MPLTHPVHAPGYSDFFTSGIRLVSRRFATEDRIMAKAEFEPIPLSFDDTFESDSDLEVETAKAGGVSRFMNVSLPKPPSPSSNTSKSRKQQNRRSSLISITHHLFGSRKRRSSANPGTGATAVINNSLSNDESGWVSSASSDSYFNDPVDFLDASVWPECPNGGLERHTHVTAAPELQPAQGLECHPLDPFSSSPSSKSFFVDTDFSDYSSSLPSSRDRDGMIPIIRNRTHSSPNPQHRFSFSSFLSASTTSLFSSSSRNSSLLNLTESRSASPHPDASFLHFPHTRASLVERKRPASIHVTSMSTKPTLIAPAPPTSAAFCRQDDSHSHRYSHARSQSFPLSHVPTRSRVRSMFPPKTSSISVAIPEGDPIDTDVDAGREAPGVDNTPKLSLTGPCFQVLDAHHVPSRTEGHRMEHAIAEEEAPAPASDAQQFLEQDVPRCMDWREFCIEVLDERPDA